MKKLYLVATLLIICNLPLLANAWSGYVTIANIEWNDQDNTIYVTSPGGTVYLYWYDCPYGQCFNNTFAKANKILSMLLTAKSLGKQVQLLGYWWSTQYCFNSIRIVE